MKKTVNVGNLTLGGGKIYVQSMLNVPAENVEKSVEQALELEKAGCEIIRAAVPRIEDVPLITALKNTVSVPIVADIHFDYRIALACVEAGVDKVRINPGNIGGADNVKAVADACRKKKIPIRIGVNSGSVERALLEKYGGPAPEALVESALGHVRLLNGCDFDDIVISIKSSDVRTMIKAYRLLAEQTAYPLHLGVTEAGTEHMGVLKSAVGIGSLLCDGIGDTIRVSLTADPVKEVYAAKDILKACGLGGGVEIVSCPTCGRTKIDLISLAERVEELLRDVDKPLKVAVMGCAVNGPGEAREADIGIAGGNGEGIIFRKGEILRKVPESMLLDELKKETEKLYREGI
ncbi:MAG: flavodoxin-dependent (E)-4-hydroxy-3-methylbut-2-enyl-diphosphate synthase [Lachnospiraceae bacterium]|nr:flavodoxin-dependent (E)-4-hydroxy-3-methylbut-2-enyl-diphosphate synthase [Ruminococcus sp.]MCM1275038.1 flavodoxin-dependent (E)-4-hydroxy-3-methylbut-2-enyl-diphosphate synthase [Lachnospiraceae bacterium]